MHLLFPSYFPEKIPVVMAMGVVNGIVIVKSLLSGLLFISFLFKF